tara:strand:+ start:22010 stop:22405 length:396 start_codon:yes stop_codon:yes gene_type:complete
MTKKTKTTKNPYLSAEKMKTAWVTKRIHTRHAGASFKPWNWNIELELGDTIYLWFACDHKHLKTVITEFVFEMKWDGSKGELFFIDQNGQAKNANQMHKSCTVRKSDGTWFHADNGKCAKQYAINNSLLNK